MYLRKLIPKFTVFLLVLLLSGLLAVGPAMAEDGPVPTAVSASINPKTFANDGTAVAALTWGANNWTNYAVYYTIEITKGGAPVYIQYSDDTLAPGPNNFPGLSPTPLPGIEGTNPATGFTDPGGVTWTVPAGLAPGLDYQFWMKLWEQVDTQIVNIVGYYEGFTVTQATGDLRVYKENSIGEPQSGWDFYVYEPGTTNVVASGTTDGTGYEDFPGLDIGLYDVAEDIQTDWNCISIYNVYTATYDGTPSDGKMQNVEVVYNETVTVEFTNQEDVGNLVIHKITDPSGNEELWQYAISGESSDSGSTNPSGVLAFNNIPVGLYNISETIWSGWQCVDIYVDTTHDGTPGDGTILNVEVTAGATTDVYFVNEELGDLIVFKYQELDGVVGYNDAVDIPWAGWGFQVLGKPGTEYTDGSGYATFPNLPSGTYSVVEVSGPTPPMGKTYVCTDPGPSKQKDGIFVPVGGNSDTVLFGNEEQEHIVPSMSQWGIIALSGLLGLAVVGTLVWRRRSSTISAN